MHRSPPPRYVDMVAVSRPAEGIPGGAASAVLATFAWFLICLVGGALVVGVCELVAAAIKAVLG